jgi:hypothetical protein
MAEPDYYNDLLEKLKKEAWPNIYMFKFIVPSDNHKIAMIESFFEDDAEIILQPSSNGKYTSVTIRQVMLSAEAIMEVYKQATVVEGIISL